MADKPATTAATGTRKTPPFAASQQFS